MPDFPRFTAAQYDQIKSSGCVDESCNINYIINRPGVATSGDGGCCDCPPGPQGPPGPAGPMGQSGTGSCGKVYAGPLLPENTGVIDEQAFQDLLSSKGYIVMLQTQNGLYEQSEMNADVYTYPNGSIQFVNSSTGTASGLTSSETEFYPLAYETVGFTGISYYNHTPTFGEFLEMCGKRDASGTEEQRRNFYKVFNRSSIPSLLKTSNDPTVSLRRSYTFISNDSSATSGVNGPYLSTQFSNTVNGIINGTIRSDDYTSDNPASFTNLGHQIVKQDGSIGVAYDCETCIQSPPDTNRLTSSSAVSGCDVFIDTENGVMYTRDETGDGNWPSNGAGAGPPRFNENGIPLRRQPVIPETPPPAPKSGNKEFIAVIKSHTPIGTSAPFFRWTYTVQKVRFVANVVQEIGIVLPNVCLNGCEVHNDIDGIGDSLFTGTGTTVEMLPIRVGTVVLCTMTETGTVAFSIPNAYKVGCAPP